MLTIQHHIAATSRWLLTAQNLTNITMLINDDRCLPDHPKHNWLVCFRPAINCTCIIRRLSGDKNHGKRYSKGFLGTSQKRNGADMLLQRAMLFSAVMPIGGTGMRLLTSMCAIMSTLRRVREWLPSRCAFRCARFFTPGGERCLLVCFPDLGWLGFVYYTWF